MKKESGINLMLGNNYLAEQSEALVVGGLGAGD